MEKRFGLALKATALSGISLTPTEKRNSVSSSSSVASDCNRNTSTTLYFRTVSNILVYAKPEVRMTQEVVLPLVKIGNSNSPMEIRT